jgi:hypothetical protein
LRGPLAAPSFNGRTADSGSAYRGSNPWGAASIHDCFGTSRVFDLSCVTNFLADSSCENANFSMFWEFPSSIRKRYASTCVRSAEKRQASVRMEENDPFLKKLPWRLDSTLGQSSSQSRRNSARTPLRVKRTHHQTLTGIRIASKIETIVGRVSRMANGVP